MIELDTYGIIVSQKTIQPLLKQTEGADINKLHPFFIEHGEQIDTALITGDKPTIAQIKELVDQQ